MVTFFTLIKKILLGKRILISFEKGKGKVTGKINSRNTSTTRRIFVTMNNLHMHLRPNRVTKRIVYVVLFVLLYNLHDLFHYNTALFMTKRDTNRELAVIGFIMLHQTL